MRDYDSTSTDHPDRISAAERRALLLRMQVDELRDLLREVNRARSRERREDLVWAFAAQRRWEAETVLACQELLLRRRYGDEPLMN